MDLLLVFKKYLEVELKVVLAETEMSMSMFLLNYHQKNFQASHTVNVNVHLIRMVQS